MPQRLAHALISIHAQHPIVFGLFHRKLLLRSITQPILMQHARTMLLRNLNRVVHAAGIHHHNLVRERGARQTRRNLLRGIERDDGDGKGLSRRQDGP